MRRLERLVAANVLYVALFGVAVVVGAELARPFQSASIAFDSQAAVLYFERIVSGHRLEAFVPTTPKPLLTVVFGSVFDLTHDWRSLAWLTIGVNALAITLAAALAHRLGGAVAAGFVGLGLANNSILLFDVGFALATPYALLGLAIAGLAVVRERPRYGIAGIALCAAALARIETLAITGAVLVILFIGAAWAARAHRPGPPARAWLTPAIALVAIPILMVHDLLLAGDPLHWASVAAQYSAQTTTWVPSVSQVAGQLEGRYLTLGAVVLLALLGLVRLGLDRRHGLVVALLALGPGVAAFLVYLAARHVIVPIRYAAVIDIAVIFAGGIGLAQLSAATLARASLRGTLDWLRARAPILVGAVAGGVIAIVLTQPYVAIDPGLRQQVRSSLQAAIAEDRVVPVLREALATPCPGVSPTPRLLVPGPVLPRVAVDLGLTLAEVGSPDVPRLDPGHGYPPACAVVLHVRAADDSSPRWAALEVTGPTSMGGATVVPLLADERAGTWVLVIH